MKKKLFIFLFLITTFFACSKKNEEIELKYSVLEIDNLAHESERGHEKNGDGIKFSDYAPGVNPVESKSLIYKRLSFFAISFDKVEQARSEAFRLNQYYARNWLFDRVEGEPILEDYVIETFKASNPKRQTQRVPKTHPPVHH